MENKTNMRGTKTAHHHLKVSLEMDFSLTLLNSEMGLYSAIEKKNNNSISFLEYIHKMSDNNIASQQKSRFNII